MTRTPAVCVVFLVVVPLVAHGEDSVRFLQPPVGYAVGKIPLGANNNAVVLAPDPADENFIYAAGSFGGMARIVRLNIRDGGWTAVATCPTTVSVNGLAVQSPDAMFVSDNWNDQLLALRDDNPRDGDFDDAGEIRPLLAPILTHPTWGWTGNAVLVVRPGANRLGLPAGAVLFQSEDGDTTGGEVLAVVNPLTSPAYQPAGAAFFSGFNYGGGLALDPQGRLLVASSFFPESGKVWVCEDTSGDGAIGPGESNVVVARLSEAAWSGVSALAVDQEGVCYASVGAGTQTEIRTFRVPDDPLHTTASVTTFATLSSPYVSAAIFNTTARTFQARSEDGATMIISAPDTSWNNPPYLLTLRPTVSLGARRWHLYR